MARSIWCALALCIVLLGLGGLSNASDDGFKVIVNRDNPITVVDRAFLRSAFLKTEIRWKHNGTAIRTVDLPAAQPARDRFTRNVLGKSPAQLRIYWIQRVFSGTAVPPPEAESIAAAIAYVVANPGGVAYVPNASSVGATKVIEVE
jgi:ABC-type phosphate transport system substrate-binding protein